MKLQESLERSARRQFTHGLWSRWVDPKNPDKSVTILFNKDEVVFKSRQGFGLDEF